MLQLLIILHVLIAISLIGLILLQRGKGSDIGAAFGSGASSTVFGSQGSTPFLVKIIALLAMFFFATSLLIGYYVGHEAKEAKSIVQVNLPTSGPSQIPNQQPQDPIK